MGMSWMTAVRYWFYAETIRNPYTNERKVLVRKLEDLEASIEYRTDEFTSAERYTNWLIMIFLYLISRNSRFRCAGLWLQE